VVTNTGQGRPCSMPPYPAKPFAVGTDTAPPEQLPDLGRSLTGRQSGQADSQARNYRWIAAWQVLSTGCQGCGLGRDVSVSRCTNFSSRSCLDFGPMRLGSRLSLGAICLSLGPACLVSGLRPLRLVETFCAGARRAYCSCS